MTVVISNADKVYNVLAGLGENWRHCEICNNGLVINADGYSYERRYDMHAVGGGGPVGPRHHCTACHVNIWDSISFIGHECAAENDPIGVVCPKCGDVLISSSTVGHRHLSFYSVLQGHVCSWGHPSTQKDAP